MNIAIIPAKKNSERFKGKNFQEICGKPLYSYTVEAVKKSNLFDRIIISTDEEQIFSLEKNNNTEIHRRPINLADDKSTVFEVCIDILNNGDIKEGNLGVFLPTSPLRNDGHIKEAWQIYNENKLKTISVKSLKVSKHFIYDQINSTNIGQRLYRSGDEEITTNSKFSKKSWIPNGAIFLMSITNLIHSDSFYSDNINLYKMSEIDSIDIDTELDFEIAKMIINERGS